MKALFCPMCADILAPYRKAGEEWRLCQCGHSAVRWRDPYHGTLDVSSASPNHQPIVIGFNNQFLTEGAQLGRLDAQGWRELHERTCTDVERNYLFHKERRDCWALIVRQGESGDVFYLPWSEVKGDTP